MFIYSSSTHNFIHCKLDKALNCFIYLTPEFQVMIVDGGTINILRKFHNITLNMGENVLNSEIVSIIMGATNVVLGVQWLQSLGMVAFNFHELFMKIFLDGKEVELKATTGKLRKVIISNSMTIFFKVSSRCN